MSTVFADHFRRLTHRREESISTRKYSEAEERDPRLQHESAEETVIGRETQKRKQRIVRQGLRGVPKTQRKMLIEHTKGTPGKEAAKKYGKTYGDVGANIYYGKKRLRQSVERNPDWKNLRDGR